MKRTPFRQQSLEEVREKQALKMAKAKLKPRKARTIAQGKSNTTTGKISGKKRKYTGATAKRRKNNQWNTDTADRYFSIHIRNRDQKCLKCGRADFLSCSHYFGRRHSATRFDPQNCIALCYGPYSNQCHEKWEGPKNEYTQFMINWLGQEAFIKLSLKAGTTVKRSDAVAECKKILSEL